MAELDPLQIAQEKFARFETFYRPIEDQYIDSLFNPAVREQQVQENVGLVGQQFDNANRTLQQTNARYGQPTGDMADFQARKQRIEQALAETGSANQTRGLVYDRDLQAAQGMSAMARGLSGQVSSSAGTAANLAAQRENAEDAARASYNQSMLGLAGTAAGLGLMAMMV